MIILNGDLLENADLNVGDSAYNQVLNVNEQMDMIVDLLSPYSEYVYDEMTIGNHELRLKKSHDFDINKTLADRLGITSVSNILTTLNINGQPFIIYATHGRNSSSSDHLALGKIQRDVASFDANLYLYGHLHRCASISIPYTSTEGIKRRNYVITGAFLKYKGSYAEDLGLAHSPPAFVFVKVGAKLDVVPKIFYQDVERPDLLEI